MSSSTQLCCACVSVWFQFDGKARSSLCEIVSPCRLSVAYQGKHTNPYYTHIHTLHEIWKKYHIWQPPGQLVLASWSWSQQKQQNIAAKTKIVTLYIESIQCDIWTDIRIYDLEGEGLFSLRMRKNEEKLCSIFSSFCGVDHHKNFVFKWLCQ